MEGLKIFAVVLLIAAHESLCIPVDRSRSSNKGLRSIVQQDDKDQLSGDNTTETIMDEILKTNKENDVTRPEIFEGDIYLAPGDLDLVDQSDQGDVDGSQITVRRKRNAARDRKKLWVTRVVPYEYDKDLPDSFKPTIEEAIAEIENQTCLRFVKRTNEDLFIRFVQEKGCWSPVGRQYWMAGIGQVLSLGKGCNHKGTIMHEIMHALGFWHEQSRPDRNLYVEVFWENIEDGEAHNFNKYSQHDIDKLQVPYDFTSIMHYGRKSFSKNGEDTIRPILDQDRVLLGQRQGFTKFDVREINALYDCKGSASGGWSSWSNFGPCSTYCYKNRQRFCTSSSVSDCPGVDQYGVGLESVKCNTSECYAPIDGHWGRWSSWGACDKECDFGTQNRKRSCDDPPPKYGGKTCVGSLDSSQACKEKSCGIGPDDCEFDSDEMCHYKNDPDNSKYFNWQRKTDKTPSSSTGPSGDHTSGTGHYIFGESSGVNAGDKARLISRTFPATTGRCLTFWYHMYGSGMGELNVYVKPVTGTLRKVWSLSGDQGDEWKMTQVTLDSTSEYKVVFEDVRGSSFRADMALDDISFKESPCLEAVGCYKDTRDRALPELVKNFRGKLDWYHMDKTIADCAKEVAIKGYKVFGVQFYGECWSYKDDAAQYDKYGIAPADKCWNGVGRAWTNSVYKIV